jgi:dimethylhistidine N-methyltransferase
MVEIASQGKSRTDIDTFREDVLAGLANPCKSIPCKYFYDEPGSQLFDRITQLDEYYLTRAETQIMQQRAQEMARLLGSGCLLIEYGSGGSLKTRFLLDHLRGPAAYVPIDISREHLLGSVAQLRPEYPGLTILPVAADFTKPFELPDTGALERPRAIYFPGSTLGNFHPDEARHLLQMAAGVIGPQGALLVGIDLQKEAGTLIPAYNDAQGVTAAFNLNLLRRINRELNADFDLDRFEHRAEYNAEHHRIEMLLVSRARQTVRIGAETIRFEEGEGILTECSYKYSLDSFDRLTRSAGFVVEKVWTDDEQRFSVQYLTVAPAGQP